VNAVQASAEEGIVPGGGIAYVRAAQAVQKEKWQEEESVGARIVAAALLSPLWSIAANAGHDASMVVHEALEKSGSEGMDAQSGVWGDLFQLGIVDAAKVVRVALQTSASVAGPLLTSNSVIVELKDQKKTVAGAVK
jgi:chaperonin GroEL